MSLQKEIYEANKMRNDRLSKNVKPVKIVQLVEYLYLVRN